MQGTKLLKGDESLRKYPEYKGIFDGLQQVAKSEGAAGLWSSTLPSLVLVSNPAIQFMIYELLKREAQRMLNTQQLSGTVVFILGAISKSVSTVATYPLQVVQSKQRVSRLIISSFVFIHIIFVYSMEQMMLSKRICWKSWNQ